MSVKPILFNTEMVRAILDGKKTQTRRLIKAPVLYEVSEPPDRIEKVTLPWADYQFTWHGKAIGGFALKAPYRPGDVLYVRETWAKVPGLPPYVYKATYSVGERKWRPSIHMPKEAARIWLKVKDVRVEQLQDIDDDGSKEEGANYKNGKNVGLEEKMRRTAVERFAELWDSTISRKDLDKYGWDANPWIFVIEFERCEKPKEE